MAERSCKVCGGWHDLEKPWPHNCLPETNHKRSHLSAPMFIKDCMDPVQSMVDGKMYDSKATLRASYKAHGVTEVGNDSSIMNPKPPPKPKSNKAAVKASLAKAFSRAGLGA